MGLHQPDLIDLIYDAAFDDGLWSEVIARVTDRAGGESAVLTTLDIVSGEGTGLPVRQDPAVMNDYFDYWATRNPFQLVDDPVAYLRGWRPCILRDHDWMARDTLSATPYFNEFLRPLGATQSMFVRLGLEGTMLSAISIARPEHRGGFERREIAVASHYQRHMVRSVATARRLKVRQSALDQLDGLLASTDQAVLFLDRAGRVRRMSAAAEALLLDGGVLRLVDGRLEAPGADAALQRLIADAVAETPGDDASLSLTLPAGRGRVALTAMPLGPRSLAALSSERFVMLTATREPDAATAPTRDLDVRIRFGLTAAEARVALALADGVSLREFADRSGVSIHTTRAQLGAIFAKTATRRQADLVRLLLQPGGHA